MGVHKHLLRKGCSQNYRPAFNGIATSPPKSKKFNLALVRITAQLLMGLRRSKSRILWLTDLKSSQNYRPAFNGIATIYSPPSSALILILPRQNYRPAFNGILNRGGELTLLELHPKKK